MPSCTVCASRRMVLCALLTLSQEKPARLMLSKNTSELASVMMVTAATRTTTGERNDRATTAGHRRCVGSLAECCIFACNHPNPPITKTRDLHRVPALSALRLHKACTLRPHLSFPMLHDPQPTPTHSARTVGALGCWPRPRRR